MKGMARSANGQRLCRILGSLYYRYSNVSLLPEWTASEDNGVADLISRPPRSRSPSPHLFSLHLDQIFQKNPSMSSYAFFQPSPDLLSLFRCALFSNSNVGPAVIPERLGQFVPATSITSSGMML